MTKIYTDKKNIYIYMIMYIQKMVYIYDIYTI